MSPADDGSPAVSPPHPGDPHTIAGYRLVGRLGQGGQGVVFLGHGPEGEKVAVKLLHASFGADSRMRARFAREVEIARRVASYSTAQVLAADIEGSQPYVISEFIDGPALLDFVRARGPQRGGALTRLAIGTLTALVAVHRAGIVHRDFKPANVLLPPEGPRVVDFGIARVLDATSTLTSQVIGTPAFMAPEQLSGEPLTPATDVFAWGATMAYAATGRAPFGAGSVAAAIGAVLHGEPDLTGLDGPLRPVVTACLAKDPAVRPDAADLLARLLEGAPGVPGERPAAAGAVPERTLVDEANRTVQDLAAAPTATAAAPRPPLPPPVSPPAWPTPPARSAASPPAMSPPHTSPPPAAAPSAGPSRRGLLLAGGALAAGALGVSLPFLLRAGGHGGTGGGTRTRWTHDVHGGTVGQLTATADTLFLAPDGGALQALDSATGNVRWTHQGTVLRIVRSEDTLFVIDADKLTALGAGDGRSRWSVAAAGDAESATSGATALAMAGDAVVTAGEAFDADGGRRAAVTAVGARDGAHRWSRPLRDAQGQGKVMELTLAGSAKVVVVTMFDGVYGLAADTGDQLWHARLDITSGFGAHAVVGDTALIGWPDMNGYFYGFDAATGEQHWRASLNEANVTSLAADSRTVYFCGAHHTAPGGSPTGQAVYALDVATGHQRWKAAEGLYGNTWGPFGRLVFATDDDTGLLALDTATGTTAWDVADLPNPSAVTASDTTAFVAAGGDDNHENQTIHALATG